MQTQEALLGMVFRGAQHRGGLDEHLSVGQLGKAATEDKIFAGAAAGLKVISEEMAIGSVEAQTIEARYAYDLAIVRECSLVWIDARAGETIVFEDVDTALLWIAERGLEGSVLILKCQQVVVVRARGCQLVENSWPLEFRYRREEGGDLRRRGDQSSGFLMAIRDFGRNRTFSVRISASGKRSASCARSSMEVPSTICMAWSSEVAFS